VSTDAVSAGRTWFVVAAALAVVSLGLPWSGQLAGAAHPARVAVVAALALAAAGLRTGRNGLLGAAAAAGAGGVLLGGPDPSTGRLALAGAVVCLVLACRASGRPLLARRRIRSAGD
jgi:hypothetical protein